MVRFNLDKKSTTQENIILLNLREPKEVKSRGILNEVGESRFLDRIIAQFGLEKTF